jgi:hypothetical protein
LDGGSSNFLGTNIPSQQGGEGDPSYFSGPNTDHAYTGITIGNPTSLPSIVGNVGSVTSTPAIGGSIGNPTTNPAISGSESSATTGITLSNSSAIIANDGSSSPHENRPNYFGLVPIMRVKL